MWTGREPGKNPKSTSDFFQEDRDSCCSQDLLRVLRMSIPMSKLKPYFVLLFVAFLWSLSFADSSTLVGDWVATREDGATTTWHFRADGTVSAEFDGMEGFKGTWKLDTSKTPHPIDLTADGETVETILEFTADDGFRLEIGTANPGDPRPTKFSDMAATFKRQ
jgi:uncharacterized protein (TIGR03067 family)